MNKENIENNENKEYFDKMVEKLSRAVLGGGAKRFTFDQESPFQLPNGLTPMYLDLILAELTDNCVCQGAGEVKITLNTNKIRVEDDVVHSDINELVERLNNEKSSEYKEDGKKWTKICFRKNSGLGVSELILGLLTNTGGKLKYSATEEGRVVADITWE